MNLHKFIFALFAALTLGFQATAQLISSGTALAGTNTVISTDGVAILSLQISDTSGSANAVVVYDTDISTTTNIAKLAFTSSGSYTTNRITTFTNRAGVVQSFTNTVLFPFTTSVAAVTNEAPRVLTTVLTANQTQQFNNINAAVPLSTTRGLAIRPVGNAVYTITYVPLK